MADEQKDQNQNKRPKSIDVTKPRENRGAPISNLDASRVSEHTLREQQALEKLKKQVGTLDRHENRASKLKTIIAIVLVLLLIAILIAFLLILGRTTKTEEEKYEIQVSMEIENKSLLSVITDTGKEELRRIDPGDKLPISAYASNTSEYLGDSDDGIGTPPPVYIRFSLRLILDYEDRSEILIPTMADKWYIQEEDSNEETISGQKVKTKFYYYCGEVRYSRRINLFSELEFDGNSIFCPDGGKYGQIRVYIESVEANPDNLVNGIWPDAPQEWVENVKNGVYDDNEGQEM